MGQVKYIGIFFTISSSLPTVFIVLVVGVGDESEAAEEVLLGPGSDPPRVIDDNSASTLRETASTICCKRDRSVDTSEYATRLGAVRYNVNSRCLARRGKTEASSELPPLSRVEQVRSF